MKTVYATKTLEYLLSGTPILVFSPPYSFHSQDAKAKGWGLVVEEDAPEAIVKGIKELIADSELRRSVIINSIKEANNRDASTYADLLFRKVNELI